MTITTLDTSLARLLEPRAPRPDCASKPCRRSPQAGIPVGVFPNPIMPLITDQPERLDRLAKAARDHGATYFGGGVLFLMPCSRKVFFPFVEKHFPHLLRRYQEKYESEAYLKGPYREIDSGKNRRDSRQVRAQLRPAPPRNRAAADAPPGRVLYCVTRVRAAGCVVLLTELEFGIGAGQIDGVNVSHVALIGAFHYRFAELLAPFSIFTGAVQVFELCTSVKTACVPSTFNLYSPDFSSVLPAMAGPLRIMS